MRILCLVFVTAPIAGAATPSIAAYSGLVNIPSSDVMGKGEYSVSYQNFGSFSKPSTDSSYLLTEIGLGGRFELGLDFDRSKESDNEVYFNAKFQLYADEKLGLSVSGGFYNVMKTIKSAPYIAAAKDLKCFRLHFGAVQGESKQHWFAGIDKTLSDKWTVMADYTEGEENIASVGVDYAINDKYDVLVGALRPNVGGETTYTVIFTYSGAVEY